MKYLRIVLLVFLFAIAPLLVRGQEAAPPASVPFGSGPTPEPISEVQALVYLISGSGRRDAVPLPLRSLLQSKRDQSEALRTVAERHLKEIPGDLQEVTFKVNPSGENNVLSVKSFDKRIPAEEVLEELVSIVRTKLVEMDRPLEMEYRLSKETGRVQQLEADLAKQRETLNAFARDLDPSLISQRRLQLTTEQEMLAVELAGLQVRRKLLEKQLSALAAKSDDDADAAILGELQRSVEARRKIVEYQTAQVQAATITLDKLEQGKDELAKAELELAKYRRAAIETSGKRILELRHRLDDVELEFAESSAKKDFLYEIVQQLPNSAQVDAIRIALELDEQTYRRARQEVDDMHAELRRYSPPQLGLIVIEGSGSK